MKALPVGSNKHFYYSFTGRVWTRRTHLGRFFEGRQNVSRTIDFIGRRVDEMANFVFSYSFKKDMGTNYIGVYEIIQRIEAQIDTRLCSKVKDYINRIGLETCLHIFG